MVILYESYGSFCTGIPSFRKLVSKKSKGNISITDTFLSFESLVDKIRFQVKLSDINDIALKIRSNIKLIELQTIHKTFYTLYPMIKKEKSYSPSRTMTLELFRQFTRLVFNKDQTILFDTFCGFYPGIISSHDLKEMTIQGHIFLTEDYIFFKAFQPGNIQKIDVLDLKEITMEIVESATHIKIETLAGQTYSFIPLKRQWRKFRKDKLKTEKFYDVLNQAKMYKDSERIRVIKDVKEQIKKIKTILKVSNRLKLKMMRTTLNIDKKIFNNLIFEWAKKFNFTIDGDYLIINKDTISAFINHLESGDIERGIVKEDKTECSYCGNIIKPKAKVCPYCGNKN